MTRHVKYHEIVDPDLDYEFQRFPHLGIYDIVLTDTGGLLVTFFPDERRYKVCIYIFVTFARTWQDHILKKKITTPSSVQYAQKSHPPSSEVHVVVLLAFCTKIA